MSAVKPRPAGSLKAAVSALIDLAGGLERAAELVGRKKSQVARYGDPAAPDQMPINMVMTLEAVVGQPVVSGYVAGELGFALLPAAEGDDGAGQPSALMARCARLGAEQSDFYAKLAEALADGEIDAVEAGRLVEEVGQIVDAGMAVRAQLQARRDAVRSTEPRGHEVLGSSPRMTALREVR